MISVVIFLVVLIGGIYIGGKSAEIDINKKIATGEIFASQNNLESVCKQSCDEAVKINDDEWKRSNEWWNNEQAGLNQATNEIALPYIIEKINNTRLYRKLEKNNGDEFMNKDFAEGWYDDFLISHSTELAEAKMIREKIMAGAIYFQDIYGERVYYVPNYFKWTKEKIKSAVEIFCDGLGCNIPDIIFADNNNIFWYNSQPCIGGAESSDLKPKEEFYEEYKCNIFSDAVDSYSDKK